MRLSSERSVYLVQGVVFGSTKRLSLELTAPVLLVVVTVVVWCCCEEEHRRERCPHHNHCHHQNETLELLLPGCSVKLRALSEVYVVYGWTTCLQGRAYRTVGCYGTYTLCAVVSRRRVYRQALFLVDSDSGQRASSTYCIMLDRSKII